MALLPSLLGGLPSDIVNQQCPNAIFLIGRDSWRRLFSCTFHYKSQESIFSLPPLSKLNVAEVRS